jgi:hypothetical protein
MIAQGTARGRKRVHNKKFHSYFSFSGKLFISHERAQKVDLTCALNCTGNKNTPIQKHARKVLKKLYIVNNLTAL